MDRNQVNLYAVTDRYWLNGKSLEEAVEEAIKGGVTMVQLREKNISKDEFIKRAVSVKRITDKYKIPLIINDNVDVAIACNADGVHLGQNDMSLVEARKILGNNKIIGVSARTVEQAIIAEKNSADYLGSGAIFGTSTKKDAQKITLDTLKAICNSVSIPVVAIGGIDNTNVTLLKGSGISGIAVVSVLFARNNIKKVTESLRKSLKEVID